MRIWVDIANAPHATLFGPVVSELERRGHSAFVTTWGRGQTAELVADRWPDAVSVDTGSFARSRRAKAVRIGRRARALASHARSARCDVALGHNSYAQALAAQVARIPLVTMMDYEHQPANHLAFRLARRVVLPEALTVSTVRKYGATGRKVVHYPGVKEQLTLAGFTPDPAFRDRLGLHDRAPVVTLRPAAEGALYHRHHNDVFDDLLRTLLAHDAQVLLTPRTAGQADAYEARGVRVLREAVSGADLLYQSDVFVGAGGTMTREAAVLGTPAFSVFEGRPAAVDTWLERQGRLSRLQSVGAVMEALVPRERQWSPDEAPVRAFCDLLEPHLERLALGHDLGRRRRASPAGS